MSTTVSSPRRPGIGIGVVITKPTSTPKQITMLLGRRAGSVGASTWATPGGHLEFGESFVNCAARETLEETGLQLDEKTMVYAGTTNTVWEDENALDGKAHYVTVFVRGNVGADAVPENLEPDKCTEWRWFTWEEMRAWVQEQEDGKRDEKLFPPIVNFVVENPNYGVESA